MSRTTESSLLRVTTALLVVSFALHSFAATLNDCRLRLRSENPDVRRSAAESLGELGKPAVQSLLSCLEDSHPAVRATAAAALGRISDASVRDELQVAATDEDSSVREAAMVALCRLGDRTTLELLIQRVRQGDPMASKAVVQIGAPAVPGLVAALASPGFSGRFGVSETLSRLGKPAIASLLSCLTNANPVIRRHAADALGRMGDRFAIIVEFGAGQPSDRAARQAAEQRVKDVVEAQVGARLIELLNDGDATVRVSAISALDRLEDRAAVPALLARLKDDQVMVRRAASRTLASLRDTRAAGSLLLAGQDADPEVRASALLGLGHLQEKRALDLSVESLRDAIPSVRQSAAFALRQLQDARAIPALERCRGDADPQVRDEVNRALRALSERGSVVSAPVHVLIASRKWEQLAQVGAPAVEPLLACLRETNTSVRCSAAETLGKLQDARAFGPLSSLLQSTNNAERSSAATALGSLGDPRAVPLLTAAFARSTRDWLVAQACAEALGQLSQAGIKALAEFLDHGDAALRGFAQQGLVKAGAAAGRVLLDCCRTGTPRARGIAAQTLKEIGFKPASVADHATWLIAARDWPGLLALGAPAVPALTEHLRDADSPTRSAAARTLQQLRYEPSSLEARVDFLLALQDWKSLAALGSPALDPLLVRAKDPLEPIRLIATMALGELKTNRATETLIANLQSAGWAEQRVVAEALGKIRDPRASRPLLTCLESSEALVRQAVASALGALGDRQAVDALVRCLRDEDAVTRESAARSLGLLFDPRAIAPLIEFFRREPAMRQTAIEALALLKAREAAGLIAAEMKNLPEPTRVVAATALGQLGDPRAVPVLMESLLDPPAAVREAAAQALGALQDGRATEALIRRLRDQEPKVAAAASAALDRLGANAVAPLISLLESPEPHLRRTAVDLLAARGDARAYAPLIDHLTDPDPVMKAAVFAALKKLGEPALQVLVQRLAKESKPGPACEALLRMERAAVAPLIRCLNESKGVAPVRAAELLGQMASADWMRAGGISNSGTGTSTKPKTNPVQAAIITALAQALADGRGQLCDAAARALVQHGATSVPSLLTTLRHGRPELRLLAARSLGQLGDARAVDPLVRALKDHDECVRQQIIQALAGFDDPGVVPALMRALNDPSPLVRATAAEMLAQRGN